MTDEPLHHFDDLHVLGTQLSERIQDAEARFAALPNKCDHYLVKELDDVHPDELGTHRQGVGFKKSGKAWKLFLVEEGVREREPNAHEEMVAQIHMVRPKNVRETFRRWSELSTVSLVNKSKAVKLLPELLAEMQKEYEHRMSLIREALDVLNDLDAQLPLAAEEAE